MSSKRKILNIWKKNDWGKTFTRATGKQGTLLTEEDIECIKNSREKSSIWKLNLLAGSNSFPVILKILKPPMKDNHLLEINMYQKGYSVLQAFMPELYWIETNVNDGETWIFTEYVKPIRGQIKLMPHHLEQIIPSIAKFHARTFEGRLSRYGDALADWLPHYDSKELALIRQKHVNTTKDYLDEALSKPHLKKIIAPNYDILQKVLSKGPIFFPDIMKSGQSLIHGDLHMRNINCNRPHPNDNWEVQLVDWESAKYAPVWYDLVVLVEMLLDFRKDWRKNGDEIRDRCVVVYTREMQEAGITFDTPPLQLFKMTYLQRVLEKRLLNHLRREIRGEHSMLLERYLEKIMVWGKELELY